MKWLGYLAAGAIGLVALAFVLAIVLVDAGKVTQAAATELSGRIGQPVTLGEVDLAWFPSPAVRVADVRIGADRQPLLVADVIRLNVSLLGLFAGKIALRSIELERPQMTLALDDSGMPILPQLGSQNPPADANDDAPAFLITSLRIRDGELALGPWKIEQIEVSGGANVNLTADFDVSAEIAGVGSVRDGNVVLSNFAEDPLRWDARLDLVDVDIASLREQLAPGRAIWGKGQAKLELAGEAGTIRAGMLQLVLRPLDLRSDTITINGDVDLDAQLGESFTLDLSGAEVQLAELLRKPVGAQARAEGPLPADIAARELSGWTLRLGDSELRGDARFGEGPPELEVRGDIDFASLEPWATSERFPTKGHLRIDQLRYVMNSRLSGEGRAQGIVAPVSETRSVELSGPVFVDGSSVGARELGLQFLGETFTLSGTYDLARRWLDLTADATGVELSGFSKELGGEARITGKLYARVSLAGPPSLPDITGQGEFEIPGGEMVNASIANFLSTQGTRTSNVDPFRRMAGRFIVRDQELEFSDLAFEQAEASASLTGTLSLLDGSVNLKGEARYFAGSEIVGNPVTVTGPVYAMRANIGEGEAKEAAAQRAVERRMLQGMKDVMQQRGVPDDPSLAAEYRRTLRSIDRQLESYPSEDENASSESALPEEAIPTEEGFELEPGEDAELAPSDDSLQNEDPTLNEVGAGFEP